MIELEVWVNNPNKSGHLKFKRMRTFEEINNDLVSELKKITFECGGDKITLYGSMDYFSPSVDLTIKLSNQSPEKGYRRVACFPVTGSNEGHYIHIVLFYENCIFRTLFLGKTFYGWDVACKIANEIGRLLGV